MSLILDDPNEAIKAELMQAINPSCEGLRRRIVFAAAGNNGGNDLMPWPASLQLSYPGIIPIHATDGMGTASNINPTIADSTTPIYIPLESFATLGLGMYSQACIINLGQRESIPTIEELLISTQISQSCRR